MKSEEAYHFSLNYQTRRFNWKLKSLTGFVDQLNAPAGWAFPTLTEFDASSNTEVLKWTDLAQYTVYQILSMRTVNTHHGQSHILSLQVADGFKCSEWACGMLAKELLQNPMVMVTLRLFVRPTGSKTSKIRKVYNSYKLLQCCYLLIIYVMYVEIEIHVFLLSGVRAVMVGKDKQTGRQAGRQADRQRHLLFRGQ